MWHPNVALKEVAAETDCPSSVMKSDGGVIITLIGAIGS